MTDSGPVLASGDDWIEKLGSKNNADKSGVQDSDGTDLFMVHGDAVLSGSCFLDENDMASDDDGKVASQQSIKKYVDDSVSGMVDTTGTPVDNDFAKFTDANTVEGRSYAEVKEDLNLEIGTDVLAQQTIGIADNNLVEIDGSPADDEFARFTSNGIEGRTIGEMKTDIGFMTELKDDTSPEYGGHMSQGEFSHRLDDALSATGKWSGKTIDGQTLATGVGQTIIFGDPVYFDGSSWRICNATSTSTMLCAGISLGACGENTTAGDQEILLSGMVSGVNTRGVNYAFGAQGSVPQIGVVYIGETDGFLILAKPTTINSLIQAVGWAYKAGTLYFDPDMSYEVAP